MDSSTTVNIIIGIVTFVLSVSVSMFVSGTRWGRVETTLFDLQKDRVRQSDVAELNTRLARIEGMFTLTLVGDERKRTS